MRPYPPRDLQIQPSAGGVLLTWKLAENSSGQDYWRLRLGDESTVFGGLLDRATRQAILPASSAATISVFVSALNKYGEESQLVNATGAAATWTDQPDVPAPPPGYDEEESGGGDQTPGGGGFGGIQQ